MMGWKGTAIAIWTAALIPIVAGQVSTNVSCRATSSWMANSLGQNPCLVSAYLSSVCNDGSWFVPTLVGQGPYNPPENSGVSTCRCNTVTYSMLQACSACQDGLLGTWSNWITYCPSSWVAKSFPNTVPSGTVIPGWATALDPTISGMWNATAAQAYAATASPTSGGASGGSKKKSNAGAIAGGVIGGIAAIIIGALLVWFYMQRSSRGKGMKVTPAPYNDPGLGDGYNNGGYVEKPGEHNYAGGAMSTSDGAYSSTGYSAPASQPFKPYDPSDPSTFPTSPAPTSTYVTHDVTGGGLTGSDYQSSGYPGHGYPPYQGAASPTPLLGTSPPPQHRPGAYTGAAEV